MRRFDQLHLLPEGGFHEVLTILGGLPTRTRSSLDWDVTEVALAELADPMAAMHLMLALGHDRPLDIDGRPLGENTVMIELADRSEAELVLSENCSSLPRWTTLLRVQTNSANVHRAFVAYSAAIARETRP